MDIPAEAFKTLELAFERAKRFFQRRGLNEQDAEDCAAEVRLQLLQRLQHGRTLSFAYLERMMRGVLADFVQAQQRQPPDLPLEAADSCRGELGWEQWVEVWWALEQLPPNDRALVWLHDGEGYTVEELTERFGCSAACLRQRLHRARKRLRQLLELE